MARGVDPASIVHKVLDDRPGSPLVATYINSAYVLVPRKDDWTDLRQLAEDMFTGQQSDVTIVDAPKAAAVAAKVRIEIRNGSGKTGLARDMMRKLTDAGYIVTKFGNADSFAFKKTVIYDLTGGAKKDQLDSLKQSLGYGADTAGRPPAAIAPQPAEADFLIILGQDSPEQI